MGQKNVSQLPVALLSLAVCVVFDDKRNISLTNSIKQNPSWKASITRILTISYSSFMETEGFTHLHLLSLSGVPWAVLHGVLRKHVAFIMIVCRYFFCQECKKSSE